MQTKWNGLWKLATLLLCAITLVHTAPAATQPPPTSTKLRESPPQFLNVAVPDVKGKTIKEAETALLQAGLGITLDGKVGMANKLMVDRVASQDPAANNRAPKGSKVKVKVYFYQVLRY